MLACSFSLEVPQVMGQPLVLNGAPCSSRERLNSPARPQAAHSNKTLTGPHPIAQKLNVTRKTTQSVMKKEVSPRAVKLITQSRTKTAPATSQTQIGRTPTQSRARKGTVFPIFAATQATPTESHSIWNQISDRLFPQSQESTDEMGVNPNDISLRHPEDIDVDRAYRSPNHLA